MRRLVVMALVLGLTVCTAYCAQTIEEKGTVEAVTLFRGQALVTRAVPVSARQGSVELTVIGLPKAAVGDSLFVNAAKDLQVRAVRYRTRAVGEAPEKEVKTLDDEIAAVQKEMRANAKRQILIGEKKNYLKKLESFVAPSANVEMSKGILNAETLAKITAMAFEQRAVLAKEELGLSESELDLAKKLELLQRKRRELSSRHSKTLREAVIFLDKTGDAKSSLRLSYLVQDASWSPAYNVRGSMGSKTAAVELAALAQQTSGEDWDAVELTLSTAGAQLVADGPSLAPLMLHLSRTRKGMNVAGLEQQLRSVHSQLRSGQLAQQKAVSIAQQEDIQWGMNWQVQALQQMELASDANQYQSVARSVSAKGSGLAVAYRIEGKVSLASRHDNQMVRITKLKLPVKYFYEATPLLTEYVYRYAEMVNKTATSLLEGRASVYLDGQYMGTANVPMVARGQTVTIGFGTDPQLRAWREFISKDEKGQLLGSNKEVTYKYRLVLDNYGDEEIEVRAFDRIPVETENLRVTLGELKDPLSSGAEYVRAYRPQGILRWDVKVPAKSARETARIIEYSFKLRYDAKLYIAPVMPAQPAAAEKMQFKKMMRARQWLR